jgi:alkylation response protein AidB-like acyl-CoA dehydrogenase
MDDPDLLREQARAWIDARFDPGMSLRSWLELLADSGWAAPAWPTAWYGKDLPAALAAVAIAEFGAAGVPGPPAGLGPLLAAPTIIARGTDELKRKYVRAAPAPAIYGGSDQIQRNVIGERVLGLPKEPDVSRDVPFRDLKKGTQEARSS